MVGIFRTGQPTDGPFTPYRYDLWNGQAEIYHWDPNPAGGHQPGGSPAIIFVHGGGFTSGNASQSFQAVFQNQILGRSDTYPVHHFSVNVRQARTVFSQINFWKRRHPSTPGDVIQGRNDLLKAIRFILGNAEALGVNPLYWALGGESAGSIFASAAAYSEDAKVEIRSGKRNGNAVNARPPVIFNTNCPYAVYTLRARTTGIDGSMVGQNYANADNQRNTNWEAMRPLLEQVSGYDLALERFQEDGYAPPVATGYDNEQHQTTPLADFSQDTAHTARNGYWFHRRLQDDLGYADTKHHLGYFQNTPAGVTESWAQNSWGTTPTLAYPSFAWLAQQWSDLGYGLGVPAA